MTRARLYAVFEWAVAIALVVWIGVLAVTHPQPMPPPVATPRADLIAFHPGRWEEPMVRYSDATKTLTVSDHAPRELLICIKGRCDLAEGWLGK